MKTCFVVIALLLACCCQSGAATYYTAKDGSDSNPGSSAEPWLTIQKGANTILAGDKLVVRAGTYVERITTIRGGSSEAARITFEAEGTVIMRGWVVNHPYITLRGFRVSQWSNPNTILPEGNIRFLENGDYPIVEGCTVGGDLQIVRPDVVFNAANSTINSASGGFLAAGFAVGQTIRAMGGTNGVTVGGGNDGPFIITAVTDTSLTLDGIVTNQGPLAVYLDASYAFGLQFHSRSAHAIVRNNTFSNMGYDTWWVEGFGHLFVSNVVENCNGWDIVRYTGTNQVFAHNWFRDSPPVVYQVSPDFSEASTQTSARYENILFTNNFIENVVCVISSQKQGSTINKGLTYTRNVFIGTGRFSGLYPNTTFENNTFLRVSSQAVQSLISVARHPLAFDTASYYATNAVIRNNIFVGCGQVQYPYSEAEMGWYQVTGSSASIVAEGNYVSSAAPGYAAKTGWPESPQLNGGDPGFVDISNPRGPDGIPFTEDDGLRLLPTSKLILAGAGGRTIGAYDAGPLLSVQEISAGLISVSWPETGETWTLQWTPSLGGGWNNVTTSPVLNNGQFQVTLGTSSNAAAFYRLTR